jgi:hypothetical protein
MTSVGAGDMFSESRSSSSANGAVLFSTGFLLLVVLVSLCVAFVVRLLCVAADATRCFSTVRSKGFLAVLIVSGRRDGAVTRLLSPSLSALTDPLLKS